MMFPGFYTKKISGGLELLPCLESREYVMEAKGFAIACNS